MSTTILSPKRDSIFLDPDEEDDYPSSDGKPMAEDTKQFNCIVTIKENTEDIFRDREDVLVTGDLFWYAVEGDIKQRTAPDTMVVFGRPKGHRRSYRQLVEGGIAPQVTFEVRSRSNTTKVLAKRRAFAEEHGCEEQCVFNPKTGKWEGWSRPNLLVPFRAILPMNDWVSPRLGIRFEVRRGGWDDDNLWLFRPDGERFKSAAEMQEARRAAEERAAAAEERADAAQERADKAEEQSRRDREELERLRAEMARPRRGAKAPKPGGDDGK